MVSLSFVLLGMNARLYREWFQNGPFNFSSLQYPVIHGCLDMRYSPAQSVPSGTRRFQISARILVTPAVMILIAPPYETLAALAKTPRPPLGSIVCAKEPAAAISLARLALVTDEFPWIIPCAAVCRPEMDSVELLLRYLPALRGRTALSPCGDVRQSIAGTLDRAFRFPIYSLPSGRGKRRVQTFFLNTSRGGSPLLRSPARYNCSSRKHWKDDQRCPR